MSGASTQLVPRDTRALVAVDLGAESCRVSLLRWVKGGPAIELVHRFANAPVRDEAGTLRWPLEDILDGVDHGLKLCAATATEGIRAIAVDGWAVDYVRLDAKGAALARPFCYRDERTIAAEEAVFAAISPERLYEITGVQVQRLNTLNQLKADALAGFAQKNVWVNLPEYLLVRWGGRAVAEYTNATHTGMVDARRRDWSDEILAAAGLDRATMPPLVQPGTIVGKLSGPLAELPALADTALIAPACHDTASAIAGIPAAGDDWAYISSGTWSLVGTVLPQSCTGEEQRREGYTNLGGIDGKVCFHRNINGMWLLKQCMNAWAEDGWPWEIGDLIEESERAASTEGLLDVDDPDLLLIGHMPQRINAQRTRRGLPPIDEAAVKAPVMTRYILESLASRYGEVLRGVERYTGKKLKRLFVVGGGSRNMLLRRLTADATGLEVTCTSPESSTIGNFAVQLAALESGSAAADWAARMLEPRG